MTTTLVPTALAIATAPLTTSTHWEQSTITWEEFTAWAENPASRKECGNYVLGTLNGGRRLNETVIDRHALTLDADTARPDLPSRVASLGVRALVHSTYSSTPESPRYRIILPLDRPVTPGEFETLTDELMHHLGTDEFDRASRKPAQFMYRPAAHDLATYEYQVIDGPPLAADQILATIPTPVRDADATPAPALAIPAPDGADDARAAAYVRSAVPRVLADLAAAAALPEGVKDDRGRGWESDALASHGNRLVELSNTAKATYPRDRARADFLAVAPAGEQERFARKWEHAEGKIGDTFPPIPDRPRASLADEFSTSSTTGQDPVSVAGDDQHAATLEPADGEGKRTALAVLLRQHVEDHYDVFPAADDERIYAQPKTGGRAELLDGGFIIRAAPDLGRTAGNLSTAATEAAKVLAAIATNNPPRTLSLRVHHQPSQITLDLAQPGTGRCVIVTPTGWTIENSPPPGVVFTETGRPLPDPIRGGHIDELRTLLRWPTDDPRWPLIKGWLPTALLADLPRPILGIFGPQGSAKTTTGRFVAGLIDPKPAGTLGSGFGKNRTDDETKAVRSYIPAWDNVSTMSGESADFLSRMVTGDLIERRKLYTDASVAEIHYRRTAVITGIAVPRGIKPDTLDRLILIDVQPLTGPRISEGALAAEWEQTHPRALAGMLDLATGMLSRLEVARGHNTAGLRMADYAEALYAIDPDLYQAYAENVSDARGDMAADDPFIQTLLRWLGARGGQWEGTPTEALEDAEWFRRGQETFGAPTGWWPTNGRAFSIAVTQVSELLRETGVTVTGRRSKGTRLKRFELNSSREGVPQGVPQEPACGTLRHPCGTPETAQTQWQRPESTEGVPQVPQHAGTPLFPSEKFERAEGTEGHHKKAPQRAALAAPPAAPTAEALEPPRCDACGDYLTDADHTAGRSTHPDCQETTR